MSLALFFHYLMLNMFRMLLHPSSGACDLFVELFHGLYCSGTMCVCFSLFKYPIIRISCISGWLLPSRIFRINGVLLHTKKGFTLQNASCVCIECRFCNRRICKEAFCSIATKTRGGPLPSLSFVYTW